MTFMETLQGYVNCPYEELVKIGKADIQLAFSVLRKAFNSDPDALQFLIILACTAMAADGVCHDDEVRFIQDTIRPDLSREMLEAAMRSCSGKENLEYVNSIVDAFNNKDENRCKAALCSYTACVIAVDGEINQAEYSLLINLLN